MKGIATCLLLIAFFASKLFSQNYAPGELFVIFKSGSPSALTIEVGGPIYSGIPSIDSINQANGYETFYRSGHPGIPETRNDYIFTFPENANIPAIAALYRANPDVKWAGPNYLATPAFTPNDPLLHGGTPKHWSMDSLHLKLERAWDITKGDTSVVIAVIDGGTFWKHVDIEANLWINAPEDSNGNGKFDSIPSINGGDLDGDDDDGNGFIDDVIGYDFSRSRDDRTDDPIPRFHNHGTVTASLAGAVTNNAKGISSAGYSCRLMILPCVWDTNSEFNIWQSGEFGLSAIRNALFYAARNGADVVNMSFGYFVPPLTQDSLLPMKEALDTAFNRGLVLVAAAHNQGIEKFSYPASYGSRVISVASTNFSDYRSPFSNYSDSMDLTAPGENYAAFMQDANPATSQWGFWADTLPVPYVPCDGCDAAASPFQTGTSLSTPLVAGVAGLVKSLYPNWKNTEIMAKLRSSTDSIRCCPPEGRWYAPATESTIIASGKLGTGRLNAFKAVTFFDTLPKARTDTALSGTIYVSGDLLIPADKVCTLRAGTVLKFYPDDIFNKGNASKRGEIIVKGSLVAIGTSTDSIKFISYRSTPLDTDWYAVRVDAGGSFKAAYCQFKNAYAGIDYRNSANDTVKNCLFLNNFMYGIRTKNSNLVIQNNTIKDMNVGYGIYLDSTNSTISGNTISNVIYGIDAYKSFPMVSNNTIIGTALGSGSGTQFGFRTAGTWTTQQTPFAVFSNNLDSGQFDQAAVVASARLKVQGSSRIKIVAPSPVPDEPPQNIAILGLGADTAIVRNSTVSYSGYSTSLAALIKVTGQPTLNLGRTNADSGKNSILKGTKSKSLENTLTDSTVFAEFNYWGVASPPSTYFQGLVDFTPFLSASPKLIVSREDESQFSNIPANFSVSQNYPNPFNPTTTINFSLPIAEKVALTIYNILGQKIKILLDGEKPAGTHNVIWDGTDSRGAPVSSGIYFYKIQTASFREVKRMVFVK